MEFDKNNPKSLPESITKYDLYSGLIESILLFPDQYASINQTKSLLDSITNWDRIKKFSNNYELIHMGQSKKRHNSISRYIPLSRSFFKLWQILYDFRLLENTTPIRSLSLAEGPGGFMEALSLYRKNCDDIYYGVTLGGSNNRVPNWKILLNKESSNYTFKNMQTIYGNLYEVSTITELQNNLKQKVDLITADGGFDYSDDFCNQEKSSHKIIFSEIINCFIFLKTGGVFICKIFDLFSKLTCKMLYLLFCTFDKITIVKPDMSRPGNSEKYVVAENYIGISKKLLSSLVNVLKLWHENDYDIIDFSEINMPNVFVSMLETYNNDYCKSQSKSIIDTVSFVDCKFIDYDSIYKEQCKTAVEWCQKYKLNINESSQYYQKYSKDT